MLKGRRKYIIYSMILLLVVGLSVGFSAFQKQLLIDDSIFKVRLQEDTRVSASVVEKTSGDAVSNSEDYNVSKIYGNVTFPTTSSYVLYKVDLTNYGNVKTGLLNITSNTSGVNYSICNSSGSNCSNDPKTAVCSGSNCTLGSTKTIYVKVTSTTTGTKNIDLDLDFEPYHTIEYENFNENTSSFETEIMENDTYEITLTSDVEEVGVSGTGYASYNKSNHKLTISGVTSNITLTAKYLLTDIAETSYSGSNPDNYVRFNNELYRIVTKEIIDDGYGNEELRGKIVKVDSIGKNPFDTNGSDMFEKSSINVVLNTTYYNTLSDEAKNLIDTSNWHDELGYYGYIAFVSKNDYQDNSSWLTFETYTSTWHNDGCYYSIQNGILKLEGTSTSLDTHPTTYLKKDVLIVGGTGTSTNPYILELKGDGLQPNPTKITGKTLTMNGSNQNLITVENQLGVPHYSVGTRIDADNYDDYNGTIPQRSAVGYYTVFYYIPAIEGFKPKSGGVTSRINGIKYTVNYTKGENISSIGREEDSCTTSGTATTCSVQLPTITPNAGWENGRWNYNSNQYNPGSSFTLNASNSGLTMTSSVSGKTYTATIYYYDGSDAITTTKSCNVTTGNSCNITLPSEVTNSTGVYGGTYKGVASTTNTMETTTLSLNSSTTLYAVYSSSITNHYYNGSSYTTRTLYRNEYFKNNTSLDSRLATSNDSVTNYTTETGVGSSTWLGLSTANDTTAEYNSVESAASSTSTTLYTIYQFSVSYHKGSNVSEIGATGGTCKITSQTSCSVTLPSITPNTGYTSVGWSETNGDTTGITGTYTINTNGKNLYATTKGAIYTATFYYYNGSSIATATSNCTVSNVEGNCNVSVPNVVQSSSGQYGGAYKGVAASASTMDIASSMVINNNTTKYYAIYSTNVTRYYYSSGYKSGTIYRNEFFIDDSTMNAVLTASDVGTVNYTSARGPGSSNWLGLSTALDTTPEYSSVSAAAKSTNTTFYTVYQFVVNFSLGSNVEAIGATSSSCNVTTSDTTCTVIFPSITPNTGYMSVGWSLTNGDTTGEPALSLYTVTNNNRVFYANAIGASYLNTTTNEAYSSLSDAFNAVSNNQTIKVLQDVTETTQASLESGRTGIKLDLNGKTITMSSSYIKNNGTLDIYNTSSSPGTINGGDYQVLYNNGTLSLNGTSTTNKIIIDKTANNNTNGSIFNNSSQSLTVNDNVEIKVSGGSSYGIFNIGTTTISGGTITAPTSGISNQTTGELNISGNSTQISSSSSNGIFNSGTTTISGGTITGSSGIYNAGGELNISGDSTQITGTSSSGISNSGTTTISGGTITGSSSVIYNSGAITMSGGTITGTSTYGFFNSTSTTSGTTYYGNIIITGGTIQSSFSNGIYITSGTTVTLGTKDSTVSTSSPVIQTTNSSNGYGVKVSSGGIFNFYDGIIKSSSGTGYAISGTVNDTPTGYFIYKETTDGVESAYLAKQNYQNTSTNVYYEGLGKAFTDVENNQTIKVLQDNSSFGTLASGKSGIKLDLNGKTINSSGYVITNNGDLKIYSNISGGKLFDRQIRNSTAVINYGTLELNSIEVLGRVNGLSNQSGGTVLMIDCSLTGSDEIGIRNDGLLTIKGGSVINHAYGAILLSSGSTLNLGTNDSDVSSTTPLIETTFANRSNGIQINSGATFNYYDGVIKSASGTGYAISGTVSDTPTGYRIYKETIDGIESAYLVNGDYLNTTTGTGYSTLNDAFSAVANNQTIKVLNDTTETVQPTLASDKTGIKLDLNGKTITMNDTYIKNNGILDIYNTSNTTGIIDSTGSATIVNTGELGVNEILSTNDVIIQNSSPTGTVISGGTLTNLNKNVTLTFTVPATSTRYLITNGNVNINGANLINKISSDDYGNNYDYGILMSSHITFNFNDGILDTYGTSIINNAGTFNASSGSITGSRCYSSTIYSGQSFNISGDVVFRAKISECIDEGGYLTNYISGGTIISERNNALDLRGTGSYRISGGNIEGKNDGIYIYNDLRVYITGGHIIGNNGDGIAGGLGSVYIGENDGSVNIDSPIIETKATSKKRGIGTNTTDYVLAIYDGIIKSASGTGYAIEGKANVIASGYAIQKTTTNGVESARLVKAGGTLALGNTGNSSFFNNSPIGKTYVQSITFKNTLGAPSGSLGSWDASLNQDNSIIVYYTDTDNNGLYEVYIQSNGLIVAPQDSSNLFYGFTNMLEMNGMEYFNTSNVTNMDSMLFGNASLSIIDVSHFDTARVTNMHALFGTSISFGIPNSTQIYGLTSFYTRSVTDMSGMFSELQNMTSIDLSRFYTSGATNMTEMFYDCKSLITLNLGTFGTATVTMMDRMFKDCTNLTTIYVGSNFNTNSLTSSQDMFLNCTSLVGGNGTHYNSNRTDATYAHIDGGTSNPGYFTSRSAISNTNGSNNNSLMNLSNSVSNGGDAILNKIEGITNESNKKGK